MGKWCILFVCALLIEQSSVVAQECAGEPASVTIQDVIFEQSGWVRVYYFIQDATKSNQRLESLDYSLDFGGTWHSLFVHDGLKSTNTEDLVVNLLKSTGVYQVVFNSNEIDNLKNLTDDEKKQVLFRIAVSEMQTRPNFVSDGYRADCPRNNGLFFYEDFDRIRPDYACALPTVSDKFSNSYYDWSGDAKRFYSINWKGQLGSKIDIKTGAYAIRDVSSEVEIIQDDFTLSLFCKTADLNGTLFHAYSNSWQWYHLAIVNGKLRFSFSARTYATQYIFPIPSVETSFDINDDEWHSIVAVRNKTQCCLYVDGNLIKLTSAYEDPGEIYKQLHGGLFVSGYYNKVIFGAKNYNDPEDEYSGYLDEIRMYKRALTAAEAAAINGDLGSRSAFYVRSGNNTVDNAYARRSTSYDFYSDETRRKDCTYYGYEQKRHYYGGDPEDIIDYDDTFSSGFPTDDNGVIICGTTSGKAGDSRSLWLIKLNAQNSIEWEREYYNDVLFSRVYTLNTKCEVLVKPKIIQLSSGDYLALYQRYQADPADPELYGEYLVKISEAGDVLWRKFLQTNVGNPWLYQLPLYNMFELAGGDVIIHGQHRILRIDPSSNTSEPPISGDYYSYACREDISVDVTNAWPQIVTDPSLLTSGSSFSMIKGIPLPDGGCVFGGLFEFVVDGTGVTRPWAGHVVKLNSNMEFVWSKTYLDVKSITGLAVSSYYDNIVTYGLDYNTGNSIVREIHSERSATSNSSINPGDVRWEQSIEGVTIIDDYLTDLYKRDINLRYFEGYVGNTVRLNQNGDIRVLSNGDVIVLSKFKLPADDIVMPGDETDMPRYPWEMRFKVYRYLSSGVYMGHHTFSPGGTADFTPEGLYNGKALEYEYGDILEEDYFFSAEIGDIIITEDEEEVLLIGEIQTNSHYSTYLDNFGDDKAGFIQHKGIDDFFAPPAACGNDIPELEHLSFSSQSSTGDHRGVITFNYNVDDKNYSSSSSMSDDDLRKSMHKIDRFGYCIGAPVDEASWTYVDVNTLGNNEYELPGDDDFLFNSTTVFNGVDEASDVDNVYFRYRVSDAVGINSSYSNFYWSFDELNTEGTFSAIPDINDYNYELLGNASFVPTGYKLSGINFIPNSDNISPNGARLLNASDNDNPFDLTSSSDRNIDGIHYDQTITAWVQSSPTTHDQTIYQRSNGTWSTELWLAIMGSDNEFGFNNVNPGEVLVSLEDSYRFSTSGANIADGEWHYVALVYDAIHNDASRTPGIILTIYIDGETQEGWGGEVDLGYTHTNHSYIGIRWASATYATPPGRYHSSFNGNIDEFTIHSRIALNQMEILDDMCRYGTHSQDYVQAGPISIDNSSIIIASATDITTAVDWSGIVEVDADVNVTSTGNLTLLPGTLLKMAEGSGITVESGGQFTAIGADGAEITFEPDIPLSDAYPGYWQGLRIESNDIEIDNIVIRYATIGIDIDNALGTTVKNSFFEFNQENAIKATSSDVFIFENEIHNGIGPIEDDEVLVELVACTGRFNNNEIVGPLGDFKGYLANVNLNVRNCTGSYLEIFNNSIHSGCTGIQLDNSPSVAIYNNKIYENTHSAINLFDGSHAMIFNNTLCGDINDIRTYWGIRIYDDATLNDPKPYIANNFLINLREGIREYGDGEPAKLMNNCFFDNDKNYINGIGTVLGTESEINLHLGTNSDENVIADPQFVEPIDYFISENSSLTGVTLTDIYGYKSDDSDIEVDYERYFHSFGSGAFGIGYHYGSLMAASPVDVTIIDPDGLILNKSTNQTDASNCYYEYTINDHKTLLLNYTFDKVGVYSIVVESDSSADPGDVYSLIISDDGKYRQFAASKTVPDSGKQHVYRYVSEDIAPPAPTRVNVYRNGKKAYLNWDAVIGSDVEAYNVYRDTLPDFTITPGRLRGFVASNITSYTDTLPEIDNEMYYKVAAVDGALNISNVNTSVAPDSILVISAEFYLNLSESALYDSMVVRFSKPIDDASLYLAYGMAYKSIEFSDNGLSAEAQITTGDSINDSIIVVKFFDRNNIPFKGSKVSAVKHSIYGLTGNTVIDNEYPVSTYNVLILPDSELFSTIAEAVESTTVGDTVVVFGSGIYTENLNVTKKLLDPTQFDRQIPVNLTGQSQQFDRPISRI